MKLILQRFPQLTLNQLYQILALRNQVFVVEQNCPYQDIDHRDENAFHLFLEEERKIIGYLRIIPHKADFSAVSIGRFCIAPEYRDRKLGRDIFYYILDYIDKRWKSEEIFISAQKYLKTFYLSFGFLPVSEVYEEDGIPHLDMKRILKN
jgi:Predicted acyltransferase